MLNQKWFFFNSKIICYSNTTAPANHYYVSTSQKNLNQFNLSNYTAMPLDITVKNNFTKNTGLILLNQNNAITQLLWTSFKKNTIIVPYKGLHWSIREVKEFFNIKNLVTIDSRNLLLDYTLQTAPLQKSYPTQGLHEVYFNFYSQQVAYSPINFIEL